MQSTLEICVWMQVVDKAFQSYESGHNEAASNDKSMPAHADQQSHVASTNEQSSYSAQVLPTRSTDGLQHTNQNIGMISPKTLNIGTLPSDKPSTGHACSPTLNFVEAAQRGRDSPKSSQNPRQNPTESKAEETRSPIHGKTDSKNQQSSTVNQPVPHPQKECSAMWQPLTHEHVSHPIKQEPNPLPKNSSGLISRFPGLEVSQLGKQDNINNDDEFVAREFCLVFTISWDCAVSTPSSEIDVLVMLSDHPII